MTEAYVGLFAFDLTLVVVGAVLLDGLGVVRLRRGDLRYVGLALFVGWAASALCAGLTSSFGISPGPLEEAVQPLALVVLGLALRPFFRRVPDLRAGQSTQPLLRAVGLAGAALLVCSVGVAITAAWRSGADSSWDVWSMWVPKGEAIYWFHGLDTGLSGFTTYAWPSYPPAAPELIAAAFRFMGGPYATLLPLQQTIVSAAFVGSLVVLLRRHVQAWILFPTLAMLSLAPEFWNRMASVLPDQSIGYLIAFSMVVAVLWLDERESAWLCLAVIGLGAAALTKDEGVVLGLGVAVVVTVAALVSRRDPRGFVLFLGPLAIAPWHLWLSRHHLPASTGAYSWIELLHPRYLDARLGRLGYAVRHLLELLFSYGDWRLVFPLALAALVVGFRYRPLLAALLLAWLVLAFAGLASVYWIGTPNLQWYVATSAQRVVGSLPIVAGALLPLFLAAVLTRPRVER